MFEGLRTFFASIKDALTWWVTVAPWEQAIRVRLGKHVRLLNAGIHLKVPWLDRIYRQSVRMRMATVPAQTLTTGDGKPLTIAINLGYRIGDLLKLYETLHDADGTIGAMVAGAVGEFVATRNSWEVTPDALAEAVESNVSLEQFGVTGVRVSVQTFAFVRTFRFITGEGASWSHGSYLDTSNECLERG